MTRGPNVSACSIGDSLLQVYVSLLASKACSGKIAASTGRHCKLQVLCTWGIRRVAYLDHRRWRRRVRERRPKSYPAPLASPAPVRLLAHEPMLPGLSLPLSFAPDLEAIRPRHLCALEACPEPHRNFALSTDNPTCRQGASSTSAPHVLPAAYQAVNVHVWIKCTKIFKQMQ